MENAINTVAEDLDLSGLPAHLHEWARNLEAEANRVQSEADAMATAAGILALKFATKSVLGEENESGSSS